MWNNSVFCLWCFPPFSLCCTPPCLLFMISSIDLQMYCFFPSTFRYIIYFLCFNVRAEYFVFSCVRLPCISCLKFCVFSLCSLAVFWILKCSACSLEGEWWLASWSDQFTMTQIWASVLFCNPSPCWGTCSRNATNWFSGMQPQLRYQAPCFVTNHREKMDIQCAWCIHNICKVMYPLVFTYLIDFLLRNSHECLIMKLYEKDEWSENSDEANCSHMAWENSYLPQLMPCLCSHLQHALCIEAARGRGRGVRQGPAQRVTLCICRVIPLMSLRGLTEELEELYLCRGIGALMSCWGH